MSPSPACVHGVYPILDADFLNRLPQPLPPAAVADCLAGLGIAQVQLRCKGSGLDCYLFAQDWSQALRRYAPRTRLLVNDRVDVALAVAADGVHVGQADLPVAAVRSLLGRDKLIGLSTHNPQEILAAREAGADYAGFGPLFDTRSKLDTQATQGLAGLRANCVTDLPVVAIGGIGIAHLAAIRQAGASGAAMIAALWQGDWQQNLRLAAEAWGKEPLRRGSRG